MGKPVNLGPFIGMNSLADDYALPAGEEGRMVRFARNVVFTDQKKIRRRAGATEVVALTAPHSLACGYYVIASALYKVNSFSAFSASLVASLSSNSRASMVELNGLVYFSNGTDFLRIDDTTARKWAPPKPAASSTALGSGSLAAGDYRIAIAYEDADGYEGPTSDPVVVTATASSSIAVTFPATPTGVAQINLYATVQDGTVLMYQGQVPSGTAGMTYTLAALGREARTVNKAVLPAGTILAEHSGRLLSVVDDTLYYSEPYNYGLYNPQQGFIRLPGNISIVLPVKGGVYVVADQTYWLAGPDIASADVSPILPYGATSGTAFVLPSSKQVGWYSDRGIVIADATGQAKAVQEGDIATPTASTGCAGVTEANGTRSIVVLLTSPTASQLVNDDYTAAVAGALSGL